jgi:type VI secretion system secreted protein Hcp
MATRDSSLASKIGDASAPALQAVFGDIKGHSGASSDSSHSGQVEILNVEWRADQQATPGAGGQLNVGRANVGALSYTAYINKEFASLTQAMLQAKVIPSIEIDFCRIAGGKVESYCKFKLANALCTSIDIEGSVNGARTLYRAGFSGTKIDIESKAQTSSGSMAAGSTCTHDILKNSA